MTELKKTKRAGRVSAGRTRVEDHGTFEVRTRPGGRVRVRAKHYRVAACLATWAGGVEVSQAFDGSRPRADSEKDGFECDLSDLVYENTPLLCAQLRSDPASGKLLADMLEREHEAKYPGRADELLAAGALRFADLPVLLKPGRPVLVRGPAGHGQAAEYGAEVVEVTFDAWRFRYTIELRFIERGPEGPVYAQRKVLAPYFDRKNLDELPAAVLTDEARARLSARGRAFRELLAGGGARHMQYAGALTVERWWGDETFKADGRCMVDPAGFARFAKEQFDESQARYSNSWWSSDGDDDAKSAVLDDGSLWMTAPSLPGYSLTGKRWGKFLVAGLKEVAFREGAIRSLVMDEDKKSLIMALVEHSDDRLRFKDLVDDKGGGTIFLLHGRPGTGKTLTAEAVADALHRPLYSIGVGELGVDAGQLEARLGKILEQAAMWRAVVLLDEADIFLERRGADVVKNAMVGVFLRLLERHDGVLMLTTNRVKDFDEAVHSRVSLAIRYPDMDEPTRSKVWANLLGAAGVRDVDPAALARLAPLDGREIKNLIPMALVAAKREGVPVAARHVEACLRLRMQFGEAAGRREAAPAEQ